jgi:hypothetical protein
MYIDTKHFTYKSFNLLWRKTEKTNEKHIYLLCKCALLHLLHKTKVAIDLEFEAKTKRTNKRIDKVKKFKCEIREFIVSNIIYYYFKSNIFLTDAFLDNNIRPYIATLQIFFSHNIGPSDN